MVLNRNFGWHSGALVCRDITVNNDMTIKGDLTFGDASVDSFILKGRFSTMTTAGSAVVIDRSTYTYGELIELRSSVSAWASTTSFNCAYFRGETTKGNAGNTLGIRGMELYGVSNITSGTDGLNQICGLYSSAYVKAGTVSYTINYIYSIEANLGTEAVTALTTTQASCIYATLQTTTGLADYTKYHGIIVEGGDASASRTYGHAIVIQNPTWAVTGSTTWTTGLYIKEACTAGVQIDAATNFGVKVTMPVLTAGDDYSGIRSTVTCAAISNSYGAAGYFDTTVAGNPVGHFNYGLGSWVNVNSGVIGDNYICAQDNGVYFAGGTLSSARIIFGLRMEVPVSMAAAGRVCPFSINGNAGINAIFDVNNLTDLGTATGKSTTSTYVPLMIDNSGAIRYVEIFA